jgi:hypothetical protein
MDSDRELGLLGGAALIALGAWFFLDNLGLLPTGIAALWPALVIAAGLWILLTALARRRGGRLVAGMMVTGLGAFWLLSNLGLLTGSSFVPVLLIALGVGMFLRGVLPLRA